MRYPTVQDQEEFFGISFLPPQAYSAFNVAHQSVSLYIKITTEEGTRGSPGCFFSSDQNVVTWEYAGGSAFQGYNKVG